MFKPIMFNTEMVKAIMDGRKTQTRRIAKQLCGLDPREDGLPPEAFKFFISPSSGALYWDDLLRGVTVDGKSVFAPVMPEDILWVRENWHKDAGRYMYRASYLNDEKFYRDGKEVQLRWSPSIHMPKKAARIFLRVKAVRIERLTDITEEQAEAEGCAGWHIEITGGPWGVEDDPDEGTAVDDFKHVWDSTIKPADRDKYGWEANPWVWVIEFERCEKPEDF